MTKFLVTRYDGSKRIVSIVVDRATNKYSTAARELCCAQSAINWCCLRKPKYNSYHGYFWKYKGDTRELKYKNGKTIIMLSKDNEPIKEFFNITLATKETGVSATSISNALAGRSQTAGGYKWKLK